MTSETNMTFDIKEIKDLTVAVIHDTVIITQAQDLLDIMSTLYYTQDADTIGIVMNQGSITSGFFDLKTGFAGEILQKFSNYHVKLAIFGDFSAYKNKSFVDFMRECNRGSLIFFVDDIDAAFDKFSNAQERTVG